MSTQHSQYLVCVYSNLEFHDTWLLHLNVAKLCSPSSQYNWRLHHCCTVHNTPHECNAPLPLQNEKQILLKDILTHWGRDEITNVRLFTFKIVYFASSVPLMTWILLHVLAFHPLERLRWSLAWISSLPMGLSSSYLFWWQLMWWVTNDVAVSVCGRSGLWPFRFVAVSVCGRSGLWPFRFVAVPVCGRFGLWPFRFVAVSVVAVSVCGRYDLLPLKAWDGGT